MTKKNFFFRSGYSILHLFGKCVCFDECHFGHNLVANLVIHFLCADFNTFFVKHCKFEQRYSRLEFKSFLDI